MSSIKNAGQQKQGFETSEESEKEENITGGVSSDIKYSRASLLDEMSSLPHRHQVIHWSAFVLSLVSLVLLALWLFGSRGPLTTSRVWLEIGLCALFAVEFFTRSGFRWMRLAYLRSHFFDFIAIVPALALVNHGLVFESAWVWLIFISRVTRLVDRFLGDGFMRRNAMALLEGFEEEITDRVIDRIMSRIQADMARAGFSHGIAESLIRNKSAVLDRVKAATPREGLVPGIAHVLRLDAALEQAEERVYDAVVGIVDSEEIDRTIRDTINASFSRMRSELGEKSWRKHLGFRLRRKK